MTTKRDDEVPLAPFLIEDEGSMPDAASPPVARLVTAKRQVGREPPAGQVSAPASREEDLQVPAWMGAVQNGEMRVNRLGMVPSRLLTMPLGEPILGQEVAADVYGTSAFRLLGLPACASTPELDTAASRLKMVHRLRPDSVRQGLLQIGYDGHVGLEEPLGHLGQLDDPRQRIVREIFWPHVASQVFDQIRSDRRLVSRGAMRCLKQVVNDASDRSGILAKHALAVLYHNAAITEELGFATGQTDSHGGLWKKALAYWAEVLQSEDFWQYMRYRVEVLDDPRLRPEDVDHVRDKLPGLILGFNGLFAKAYASGRDNSACFLQLALIAKSDFPAAARNAALIAAVRAIVMIRLEPLVRRAEDILAEGTEHGGEPRKFSRAEYIRSFDPILKEALALLDFLTGDLRIDLGLVGYTEFDRLATILIDAANRRIDYSTDDRLRSILCSIQTAKRLLRLPLSASQRRKLEKNVNDDTEVMYKNLGVDYQGQDPSRCFFLGGEEADPEASLELPLYKIAKVEGANVQWECRRVLVPRSVTAQQIHERRLSPAELAARQNDETSRRLRGDIERVRAETKVQVQAVERQAAAELGREQAAGQARLQEHDRQVAAQEQRDKQALAEAQSRLGAKVKAEEARRNQAAAVIQQKHQQAVTAAEREFAESSQAYQGLNQFHVFELPTAGGIFIAMLLVELVLGAAGAFTLKGNVGTLLVVNAVLGLAAGLAVGRVIRKTVIRQLGTTLRDVCAQRDVELGQIHAEARKRIDALRAESEQELKGPRGRLALIEQRRAQIRSEAQTRIQAIQSAAKQKTDQLQREGAAKTAAWEQELARRVQVRPESDKFQHPLYLQAKRNGYRDGERPSRSEIDDLVQREMKRFMDSLSAQERMVLAVLAKQMSDEQFSELLVKLAGMPIPERRRMLESFAPQAYLQGMRRW